MQKFAASFISCGLALLAPGLAAHAAAVARAVPAGNAFIGGRAGAVAVGAPSATAAPVSWEGSILLLRSGLPGVAVAAPGITAPVSLPDAVPGLEAPWSLPAPGVEKEGRKPIVLAGEAAGAPEEEPISGEASATQAGRPFDGGFLAQAAPADAGPVDGGGPSPVRKGPKGGKLAKPRSRPRSPQSKALIVAGPEPVQLKERIELQDRFRQFPSLPLIGERYIQHHSYSNDERGDHVTVTLYPKGNPLHPGRTRVQAPAKSGAMVPYRGASRQAAGRAAILRKYLQDVVSTPSQPLSPASVEHIVKTLSDDSRTMAAARRYWERVQEEGEFVKEAPLLRLSNEGIERHFRFVPEGRSAPVDARVLDIHRRNAPYGLYILVEWMEEGSGDGVRVRHVSLLKPGELETARAAGDEERLEVAMAFEDSLSPNEIKTRKLAQALRIQTFGYTHMDRLPGTEGREGPDPLSMMSNLSPLAVRSYIEDRFGSIQDLMTPEERREELANVLDVMARLNPRYVLRRFEDRRDRFEYAFVVTEDGQLKVTPHGPSGVNLKPQNIRLAHGRRVFAAGTFTMGPDGELDVALESNGFQDVDAAWGAGPAFRTQGNQNLDDFVAAVFRLQTDRRVRSIGSRPVESYRRAGAAPGAGGAGPRRESPWSHGFDSDEAYGFFQDMMDALGGRPKGKTVDWDIADEQAAPLDFKDWLKASERGSALERDKEARLAWAHYALRTTPDMSLGQIKSAYRKLAMRFHPDRNPGRGSAPFQAVSAAFETIEADLK